MTKNLSGFTCMRYGWAGSFHLQKEYSSNRYLSYACRGNDPADTDPSYYTVASTALIQDCRARCVAAPVCRGFEFTNGRCEIWNRRINDVSRRPYTPIHPEYFCFSYSAGLREKDIIGDRSWEAVGSPGSSACRGDSDTDSNPGHYTVVQSLSLEDCQAWCVKEFPRCRGVEYSQGRCELWTRPEGIFLTKSVSGFTCMRFGWVGSFQLMGGGDRACRGYHPGDNSDSNYVVHWRISFEECKARCIASRPVCSGFEFTTGRCEVWTKSIEAVSSGVLPGYSCFKRVQMLPPLLL